MQEFFIHYMETLGYKFLAGDRNGKTINIDYLEEVTRSQYLYPEDGIFGPMLRMRNNKTGIMQNFVMPDALMSSVSNGNKLQFFDVKNRKIDNLKEKYHKLEDYLNVAENSGIPVFIALIIWNFDLGKYELYFRNVRNILNDYSGKKDNKAMVCFDLSSFKKI